MRIHGIAICTLSVLLTGGLAAQASNNPISEGSAQNPAIPEAGVSASPITATGIKAIAPPEIDSKQESRLEPSAQKTPVQKTPVAANRQAGALAQATPQTDLAGIPKVEASQLNKELSAPNANAPALAQSLNPTASQNEAVERGTTVSKAEVLRPNEPIAQSTAQAGSQTNATCIAQALPTSESRSGSTQLAQGSTTPRSCPRPEQISPVAVPKPVAEFESSPALSIYIPVAYGADRNTVFLSGSYQNSVRIDPGSVGAGGIGIGLGDARKSVGLELSYATEVDEPFGQGGFNGKLHRHFGQDLAGAIGWNGFANIGRNDFEQSKYGVLTKVFRTQESLNSPFSRVAFTVGVGDGQFRSNGAVAAGDNNVNVFGNVAVRVVRPVSLIAEWTGQDLGLGLSIAPFRNFPFVITPAVRDVVGGGDKPRFVLGAGTAIRF
jgi:hypothetical protein